MMQMRGNAREADYMTKNRTGRYWGESGFLEEYRNTLRALEVLVHKGKVHRKEKQVKINCTKVTMTEYHLAAGTVLV
ncbi:MAG: hypothetical protein ABIA12_01520 [Candidatus Aenigmatarchaeota archaeon]